MSPNQQFLLRYLVKYPSWIVVTIILGFSGALFNGIGTALIAPVLLGFLGQEVRLQMGVPILDTMTVYLDRFPEEQRLLLMAGSIVLLIFLKNAANYTNQLASSHLSRLLVRDIRLEGLKLLLDVNIDFYAKNKVGDLINRLGGEIAKTASSIRAYIQMATIAATILVFLGILLYLSWQLTVATSILLFLVALVNQYFIKRAKGYGQTLAEVSRAYSVAILEILSGIRLVKSTANESREYSRIEKLIRQRERADFQSQANSAIMGPISETTGIISLLVIVFVGRILFADQIEALSTVLLTYLVVLFRLLPYVGQLNNVRSSLASSTASVDLVRDFLRRDQKTFMPLGGIPYIQLQKGIGFEQISFAYPGQSEKVLSEINLWLPKGTTLALVGGSGAGKTTLADLVARFYDPTEGRITLDGEDLRDYDLRSLRKQMGIVSQETFLFNDTVYHNIAYAKDNPTPDEIISAAKQANAYDFIMNLPKGFETQIGDRGILLSGGQRQRLSIARALLRNPDLLILDEATSALDTVSERLVQEALENLSRDRTTVVIAHRLSTIQKADQIAVLEKGRVVEVGTHSELLNQGGYYAKLYSMQFANRDNYKETVTKTSYEVRTRLNSIIGSLNLVVDGIADTPEEQTELATEAYLSALRLLQTIEVLEHQTPAEEEKVL